MFSNLRKWRFPLSRWLEQLQEGAMLQQENQTVSSNFEWVYQALSPTRETCKFSALCDESAVCGKWFCSLYTEEEAWNRCARDAEEEAARNVEIAEA